MAAISVSISSDNYNILNYLKESLNHIDDHYNNIINARHPYPCGICQKNVNNNQKAITCSSCNLWIHIKCNGTTSEEYNEMMKINSQLTDSEIDNIEWSCNKCVLAKIAEI